LVQEKGKIKEYKSELNKKRRVWNNIKYRET
jgi:hypothetical protein